MHELLAILAASQSLPESVLITLIHTEGSTYRRPGARMLVLPGCRTIGTISGGCLEPAVARDAWAATRNHLPAILEVESVPEDDHWSPASGCHGKLFLLAEPIPANTPHPTLDFLRQVTAGDQPALILHEFNILPNQTFQPTRTHFQLPANLDRDQCGWTQTRHTATFTEWVPPQPHLLICGAGNDAQPLARIAHEVGYRVTILDSRARLATKDRFPTAEQVSAQGPEALVSCLSLSKIKNQKSKIENPLIRRHTAAVLMSHRFADDAAYLAHLLNANLPYIGILGPRRRTDSLLQSLADPSPPLYDPSLPPLSPLSDPPLTPLRPLSDPPLTPSFPSQNRPKIFSPIGLDIGSENAQTIALAIVAEIQSVLAHRSARPLTQKTGPLQFPIPVSLCQK